MKSELIVDVRSTEVSIALLENGRLVSLQKEARNISYAVGDIYLAKVKKLMPALNAAFVNVGYEKDAFLHYLDLGPRFSTYSKYLADTLDGGRKEVPSVSKCALLPEIDKQGTVTDLLQCGRQLLVQIVKEPISSKGPRITTELSFTGRFMVLIPFCDKISISQKIKSQEERSRLRQLVASIKPKNFGVIIRTSAEGKRVAELNNELENLMESWKSTVAKACKATAPALVFQEESRILSMLRDVFSSDFESIYVNDEEVFRQINAFVTQIAPESKDIVKLYTKEAPIFDHFSITRQIKSSFGKTVSFKSGSYIIIEHTEALHVIDVNSGNRAKGAPDQETNALEVNLRAADEIARQLRLRDMGGIIVIDFIDMLSNEHRQQLYEHMREVMANDRARHNILPLSKFGLMQITRQRVRPVLDITVNETCPSCFGKGEVQPSLLFTDTLHDKIEYVISDLGKKGFTVYVHPFVEAYLKKGWFNNLYSKWRRQMGRCFKIVADESLAYLQYRVVDIDGNELDLREERDTSSQNSAKTQRRQKGLDQDEEGIALQAETAATEGAKSAKQSASSKKAASGTKAKSKSPQKNAAPATEKAKNETSLQNDTNPKKTSGQSKNAEKLPQTAEKTSQPKDEKMQAIKPDDSTDSNSAVKQVSDISQKPSSGGQATKDKPKKPKALLPAAEPKAEKPEISTPDNNTVDSVSLPEAAAVTKEPEEQKDWTEKIVPSPPKSRRRAKPATPVVTQDTAADGNLSATDNQPKPAERAETPAAVKTEMPEDYKTAKADGSVDSGEVKDGTIKKMPSRPKETKKSRKPEKANAEKALDEETTVSPEKADQTAEPKAIEEATANPSSNNEPKASEAQGSNDNQPLKPIKPVRRQAKKIVPKVTFDLRPQNETSKVDNVSED